MPHCVPTGKIAQENRIISVILIVIEAAISVHVFLSWIDFLCPLFFRIGLGDTSRWQ